MSLRKATGGYTLVELLVVVAIIAIVAALSVPIYGTALQHSYCSGCSIRMRGLGVAFMEYATDNDGQLPGRVNGSADRWPTLLLPYVSDPKSYVDPGDPIARAISANDLVSNKGNHSSFFFNGFNDLGFYRNPDATLRLANITDATNLILLGQKVHGSDQYYMDFEEGNENDVLNKTAYFKGSNYIFADGSARFIYLANYDNSLWLVNPAYKIPK